MSNDECIICLEKLKENNKFTLPECNHSFCTSCIVYWFRNGHNKCPYCNNSGEQVQTNNVNNYLFPRKEKIKFLRKYANKNKNTELKELFKKLTEISKKMVEIKKEMTNFKKTEIGTYNDLNKRYQGLRTKYYNKFRQRTNLEKMVCCYPITKVIIVEKKIIYI